MKAVAGSLPTGPDWAYELKWDGMRAIVANGVGGLEAFSARGNAVTRRFPELQGLHAEFGSLDLVIDGELVAFGDDGFPSFGRLQQRMHLERVHDIERTRVEVPVVYVVFDILRVDHQEALSLPLSERRRLLEQLLDPGPDWQVSSLHLSGGPELLDAVADQAMEGVVAKRLGSPYRPGQRSPDWVKVKPRRRQELVVGGWLSGEGDRSGRVAAVVVGFHDDAGFRLAGRVGSGLTDHEAALLLGLFTPRPTSPFVDPVPAVRGRRLHFVEPTVVVEVAFGEWTREGNLRHPVYLGRRADVDPAAVAREEPGPSGR